MIYLKQLSSLLVHKWYVFLAGLVFGVPIWRGLSFTTGVNSRQPSFFGIQDINMATAQKKSGQSAGFTIFIVKPITPNTGSFCGTATRTFIQESGDRILQSLYRFCQCLKFLSEKCWQICTVLVGRLQDLGIYRGG